MAMNYTDAKHSVLDVNTHDYYMNTLRPYMLDVMAKCPTDPELYRTLDKCINRLDGLTVHKAFDEIPEALEVLNIAITDRNYFNNAMKRATEEEKEMVRNLISKISDFLMIVKCEEKVAPTQSEPAQRIDYSSSNGENESYAKHNMVELNKPIEQKRIPNR